MSLGSLLVRNRNKPAGSDFQINLFRFWYCLNLKKMTLEFFPNGVELSLNSANSGNLINHLNMNWAHFKDPISHMCFAGAVVASWSVTQ